MNHFELRQTADGRCALFAEDVALSDLAAEFGTPLYVYSRATIERHFAVLDAAFAAVPHTICYAVKAASNLAILDILARRGAGFDIVSVGELERVLLAGGDPRRVMFSGVGKRDDEIARALDVGVRCFNVESAWELDRIEAVAAAAGQRAPISLRVNPDVDARTHAYIATGLRNSKFGVPYKEALALYLRAAASDHLEIVGIDCHIGSQIVDVEPLGDALDRILVLVDALAEHGIVIGHVDMGGGLAITYRDETPAPPAALGDIYAQRLAPRGLELVVEPGRVIVGNAAVLLMRVLGTKDSTADGGKRFIVVDAAMNDNIRPSLYGAWQGIEAVAPVEDAPTSPADVVGPICESGDFFARDRDLPAFARDDLLVMRSVGAYGYTMASTYNSRPRAAEVMVDGSKATLIRARESLPALWAGERLLDPDRP